MKLRFRPTMITLLVLASAITFGCSPLPTAPELSARDVAKAHSESGLIHHDLLEPLDPLLPQPQPPTLPPIPDPDSIRAENIDGDVGGNVKVGYVDVEVPRGAYNGQAEIRITIPDKDSLMCHLEIFPASKNHFDVPVIVTFDLGNVEDTNSLGVFWFNEEVGRWLQIAAQMDPEHRKITAELSHFSQYKVAKASRNKASW